MLFHGGCCFLVQEAPEVEDGVHSLRAVADLAEVEADLAASEAEAEEALAEVVPAADGNHEDSYSHIFFFLCVRIFAAK
jgi:hypothetical protein